MGFDVAPFYPAPGALFKLAEDEGMTVFGTSAKYLAEIEKVGLQLAGLYTFPLEHILEIKYNVYTYDDLMISNNYYTGNIVEINFIKSLKL